MSDNRRTNSLKFSPNSLNPFPSPADPTPLQNASKQNTSELQRLHQENKNLKSSLKEMQRKLTAMVNSTENAEKRLKNQQLTQEREAEKHRKYVSALEEDLESCKNSLDYLQDVLKNQISGKMDSTEELVSELEKVEDPFAIVLINRIINTYNRRSGKSSFKSRYDNNEQSLQKALEDYQKKVRRLAGDKKTLKEEIEILKSQNDFLTNQLDFSNKKVVQEKKRAKLYGTEVGIEKVYDILGISEDENLLEGLERIRDAFTLLPDLQQTVEEIFTIVTKKSVMPVDCDSNEQLVAVIHNWSSNLADYQNLVFELFDILKIDTEDEKNRTHLLKSIREVIDGCREEKVQPAVMEQVKRLQKEAMGVEFFLDEVKDRLGVDKTYSRESVFSKVLKIVSERKDTENEIEENEEA